MRTVYRVTVAAVNYDDEGNFVADETLFEATHHRPEALLRFAPGEVEVVLEEVALMGVPQRVVQGLPTVPDWDRAASAPPVDGAAVPQRPEASVASAPKATRKRRTKAEIAADEAAAKLAAVQSAEVPVADVEAVAPAGAEPVAAPPAAPVAPPEPVPAEVGATPASTPLTLGEAPWNPFQTR